MTGPLSPTEVLTSLPAPVWFLLSIKAVGFYLHMVFMHIWLAGIPTALFFRKTYPDISKRLLDVLPFVVAFGINAGIVPLLFIQVLFANAFYTATILQAWFWLSVIPLLLVGYYGLYLSRLERWVRFSLPVSFITFIGIGVIFASALTLMTHPDSWAQIFRKTTVFGAVHGFYLALSKTAVLRFFLTAGMAFQTLALFLMIDKEGFFGSKKLVHINRKIFFTMYTGGTLLFLGAGFLYARESALQLSQLLYQGARFSFLLSFAGFIYLVIRPGRLQVLIALIAHGVHLGVQVFARQVVQYRLLSSTSSISTWPLRMDWQGFFFFIATFLIGVIMIIWLWRMWTRSVTS